MWDARARARGRESASEESGRRSGKKKASEGNEFAHGGQDEAMAMTGKVEFESDGDPRLAGYSKKEMADSIARAMEEVRSERERAGEGDATGALGAVDFPEDSWNTPTHLIARPRDEKDHEALKVTLSKLLTSHDVDLVSKNVKITAGVDPTMWPEGLDRAVYALKSIFESLGGDYLHPDFTLLKGLDWIEAPNSRDLDGKIAGAWAPLERHVGSLFGHLYQWQLAKDAGNKATIVVDSDGLDPVKLAVPVTSFGAIIDHAPADFDIILLNAYSNSTGSRVIEQFPDQKGNTVQLTTWREPGRTGLTTYVISDTFPDKVFNYASIKGAGYFDSWIVDDLCTHNVMDDKGRVVGEDSPEASKPLLTCYHANGVLSTEVASKSWYKYESDNDDDDGSSHHKHSSSKASLGEDESKESKSEPKDSKDEVKNTHDKRVDVADDDDVKDSKGVKKSSKTVAAQVDDELAWVKADDIVIDASSKKTRTKSIETIEQALAPLSNAEASLGAVPRVTSAQTDKSADDFVSAIRREQVSESLKLRSRRQAAIAARVAERERVQVIMKDIHDLHARGIFAGDEGFSQPALRAEAESHARVETERRARAETEVSDALEGLM